MDAIINEDAGHGFTALHTAARQGWNGNVQSLIDIGVDLNKTTAGGRMLRTQRTTPLETDQGCLRITDQLNSRDIAKLIRSVGSDQSKSVGSVWD